jgi:hypothetical protein
MHPEKVCRAINNARGWWSEDIEGDTGKADAECTHWYQDAHRCPIKVTGLVPEYECFDVIRTGRGRPDAKSKPHPPDPAITASQWRKHNEHDD